MDRNVRLAMYIALAVVGILIVGTLVWISLPRRTRAPRYTYRVPMSPAPSTYAAFSA